MADLRETARDPRGDFMQATPREPISGFLSDLAASLYSPERTQQAQGIARFFDVPELSRTLNRFSYGQPITNIGKANVPLIPDDTAAAALLVAPLVTKGTQFGAKAGRLGVKVIGQEIADRVATGQSLLPKQVPQPRAAMFAVEPSPSMAVDESSAVRQQLTGKMQALLAQKKVATSAVEVGAINQQIGELQAQFKSLPTVGRVAREVVAPQVTAPVSDLGFYSAAEQAAMNLERSKGTGQSFLNDLMNAPDVKKDELSWIGLDDFLKDKPNVTKQEVQDFIAGNRVDVQERQLGGVITEDPVGIAQRKAVFDKYEPQIQALYKDIDSFGYNTPREVTQSTDNRLRALQEMRDAEADAFYKIPEPTPTKYDKFQLPGGENYREILLTLPEKKNQFPDFEQWITKRYGGEQVPENVRQAARKEYERQAEGLGISSGYQSSHFNEPNILAHMRVNDRVDADGKKMLLVEEIQSDWHQAGREKGYIDPNKKPYTVEQDQNGVYRVRDQSGQRFDPYVDGQQMSGFMTAEAAENAMKGNMGRIPQTTGVPDAPFKDNWYQLALKRVMKYAADNGYDRVGLTTGKRQVERFSDELRQNVDEINFFPFGIQNEIIVTAKKNGQKTFSGTVSDGKFIDGQAQGKTVEEVLGKSMAKQIAEKKDGVIKGDNLTVGGEGMKKYYDEIYPKFLEKYGKKWDAKVGETKVNTVMQRADNSMIPQMGQEPIRYIDITPKMKESVSKGQPLFAAAPVGTLGLGGLEYADPFGNLFPQQPQPQQSAQPIFEKSRTWDAVAAQRAKMLEDMGTDPKTIWQQTGTWKGPDGKWRQEVMQ
jgi:hypothetical protein